MNLRWDRHFLSLALAHAQMSKDPSTAVGAVIVGPDRELISAGFNGFPRGIADTPERLHDREMKYKLIVHAEINSVMAAARLGIRVKGCTMYLVATNSTGTTWGGPPCTRCTVELIQAGIVEVVSFGMQDLPERWRDDLKLAREILGEARVRYREVEKAT